MIDVSVSDYLYEETTDYPFVYGFVTDSIDGAVLADYASNVKACYGTDVAPKIEAYNTDINCLGDEDDIRDVTAVYGIYNVNTAYYADATRMLKILKADIDNTKQVNGMDTGAVVESAFSAKK